MNEGRYLLFALLVAWPMPAGVIWLPDQLAIWNVGQGQWVTAARNAKCLHFDIGGERVEWDAVISLCRYRQNHVYFSHWDLDHVNFAWRAKQKLPNLCIAARPGGRATGKREHVLNGIPQCDPGQLLASSRRIRELTPRLKSKNKNSNESSRIFLLEQMVLIPGDAGTKTEAQIPNSSWLANARILILGHHGSRTSTSEAWLSKLPNLRLAVASSRRRKYGHPHPLVVDRVKNHGVPVIVTEDWGNIRIKF